jgi:hypothetical protein
MPMVSGVRRRQTQLAAPMRNALETAPVHSSVRQQGAAYTGNQAALRRLSQITPRIQSRLEIGSVNDPLEAEADRVADHVLRMPDPALAASSPAPLSSSQTSTVGAASAVLCGGPAPDETIVVDEDMPLPGAGVAPEEVKSPTPAALKISRMCSACAHDEDEKLHRKEAANESSSVASAEAMIQRRGSRLDPEVRSYFEPRFGHRFDQVRIHTGAEADQSARSVSALAYTVGDNIVFRGDQYRPSTVEGKKLIAHELTHVVQQGAAGASPAISRSPDRPLPAQTGTIGPMLQRWSIGDPTPGLNTIVCDGSGGISVQLGNTGDANQTLCLSDCMRQHEMSHRSDALAANANICRGVVAGKTVRTEAGAPQKATEIAASNAEITCLQGKKPTATATCSPIIAARITQMEAYRNSFR